MYIILLGITIYSLLYVLFGTVQKGLRMFLILLFCCSHIWVVSLSSIDFTVYRLILILVLAKHIIKGNKIPSFNILDIMVVTYFGMRIYALSENVPFSTLIEREMGRFLDVVVPYYLVRSLIVDTASIYDLIHLLIKIAMFLTVFSVLQSVTGINILGPATSLQRFGFYRSNLVFGDYISCGLFFSISLILSYGLYASNQISLNKMVISCSVLLIGVMSTLSSAPLFSIVASFAIISLYRYKNLLALIAIIFLILIIFLELYSNRHFYEVFTHFSFNSQSSYYRIGLMNEALGGGMDGHWLKGFGYVGVGLGNDNSSFHWKHKDLVNIYIANLVRYGLIGLIPLFVINYMYYYYLLKAKFVNNKSIQKFIWVLFSGLLGWNIAMLTVNAMGQIETLLYILIALSNNLYCISKKEEKRITLQYTARAMGYGYA